VQPTGRWPANIIHDGSDEVIAAFPQALGQQGDLKATGRARASQGIFGDMGPPRTHLARDKKAGSTSFGVQAGQRRSVASSAARFFYAAKASKSERNAGLPDGMTNTHPTVKPVALCAYLQRLVTPAGGTTLDIFMGSGSFGVAAMREGFRYIGIDSDASSVAIARARIGSAADEVCDDGLSDGLDEVIDDGLGL
jgi:site-specific DNA-methyltransferase (adenine-specific)